MRTAQEVGLKLEAKRGELQRFIHARTTKAGLDFQGDDFDSFHDRNQEIQSLTALYVQLSTEPMLPASGPLPRPQSLAQAAQILAAERIDLSGVSECKFVCDEFTSNCPKTGQPDFGKVTIAYVPNGHGLESKALKFYLWAFRDEGMFCEALAARIADDVYAAIEPKNLLVTVEQYRRGGIGLTVEAARPGYKDSITGTLNMQKNAEVRSILSS